VIEQALDALFKGQRFILAPQQQYEDLGCTHFWQRRTFNTNRAAALLSAPGVTDLEEHCQQLKWKIIARTFYIPFLYPLGLQMVVAGDELLSRAKIGPSVVDIIDNQRVVLQGVFVVDTKEKKFRYWSSPGLYLTSRLHKAMAAAIAGCGFEEIEASRMMSQ